MSAQFEYKVIRAKKTTPEDLEAALNLYGKEGWELVSVLDSVAYMGRKFIATFKRSIPWT